MTLPRFTAGVVGNLSFEHLNEAFGFIDAVRDSGEAPAQGLYRGGAVICAKILGVNGDNYSWEEVERVSATDATFQTKVGGRNSTDGAGNTFGFPARVFNLAMPAVGELALLTSKHSAEGNRYYISITGSSKNNICATIESSTPVVANVRWQYGIKEAWPTSAGVFTGTGSVFVAFNGAENSADSSVYGVGMIPPTGATLTRQPIKVGTAVLCSKNSTAGAIYAFSVPNGYKVLC